jgi:hypothetical protein
MDRRKKLQEIGNWFESDGFYKIAEAIHGVANNGDGSLVGKLIRALTAAGKHVEAV